MSTRPPPLSGGVRIYAKAPRKGGEGRQGERGGSPALAGSMRCPARCLSIGGEVVARCGEDFAQNRTRWPSFLSSWLLVRWWRSGERLAMVWTVKAQTRQRRGEELAKRSAASFALFLSFLLPFLFCLSLYSSLLFLFLFFLYI